MKGTIIPNRLTPRFLLRKRVMRKLLEGKEINQLEAQLIGDTKELADPRVPFRFILDTEKEPNIGHSAKVYEIKHDSPGTKDDKYQGIVAKVINQIYHEKTFRELLGKEMSALHHFYKRRRKVPKPKGMFNAYNPQKKTFELAIVMQKAEGMTLEELGEKHGYDNLYKKVRALADEETAKLKEIGHRSRYLEISGLEYIPGKNIIYNPHTEELKIVDFGSDNIDYKKLFQREN